MLLLLVQLVAEPAQTKGQRGRRRQQVRRLLVALKRLLDLGAHRSLPLLLLGEAVKAVLMMMMVMMMLVVLLLRLLQLVVLLVVLIVEGLICGRERGSREQEGGNAADEVGHCAGRHSEAAI